MSISIELIKQLRAETGSGLADVKEALEVSKNDVEAARAYLRKKGAAKAEKRVAREANQGIIAHYVHTTNRVGVLVEVNCETDFVARNEDFQEFARNVALQVAALSPQYVSEEDMPKSTQEELKAEDVCLVLQPFFKDGSKTIGDMMKETSAKVGEAVKIRRFTRYEVGG